MLLPPSCCLGLEGVRLWVSIIMPHLRVAGDLTCLACACCGMSVGYVRRTYVVPSRRRLPLIVWPWDLEQPGMCTEVVSPNI